MVCCLLNICSKIWSRTIWHQKKHTHTQRKTHMCKIFYKLLNFKLNQLYFDIFLQCLFLEYKGFVWRLEKQKVKPIQTQIVSDRYNFFWELRCINLDTCIQVSPRRRHRWGRDLVLERRCLSHFGWRGLKDTPPHRPAPSGQGSWKPGGIILGISNGSRCHLPEQLNRAIGIYL